MKPWPSAALVPVCIVLSAILAGCSQCSKEKDEPEKPAAQDLGTSENTAVTPPPTPTNLEISDIKVGTGAEAGSGQKVAILYTLTGPYGTQLQAMQDPKNPFEFTLGAGLVIAGLDQGLYGMREGGVRKLVIPPHLAYGSKGMSDIVPPDTTITFEVELLRVESAKVAP